MLQHNNQVVGLVVVWLWRSTPLVRYGEAYQLFRYAKA
jgi:hypothetical protein